MPEILVTGSLRSRAGQPPKIGLSAVSFPNPGQTGTSIGRRCPAGLRSRMITQPQGCFRASPSSGPHRPAGLTARVRAVYPPPRSSGEGETGDARNATRSALHQAKEAVWACPAPWPQRANTKTRVSATPGFVEKLKRLVAGQKGPRGTACPASSPVHEYVPSSTVPAAWPTRAWGGNRPFPIAPAREKSMFYMNPSFARELGTSRPSCSAAKVPLPPPVLGSRTRFTSVCVPAGR